MWHAFLFEAKSIQSYITAGGKLRHMVGASNIVHDLCRIEAHSPLALCLVEAEITDARFLRCAGGAFTFVFHDNNIDTLNAKIASFRALWSLNVQILAPGLSYVDSDAQGSRVFEAVEAARKKMGGRRSLPAHSLPAATPPILRAQRTGEAAVAYSSVDDEALDASLQAKDERRRIDKKNGEEQLTKRFIETSKSSQWPSNMETEFPFSGDDKTIAIFHADGNRMGEIIQAIGNAAKLTTDEEYINIYNGFSANVETAIERAARAASVTAFGDKLENGFYPARPIVCAGDDITIILRADIAIKFAQTFMQAFEIQCQDVIPETLRDKLYVEHQEQKHPLPRLTACGGLIFANANQPFLQVCALAESACKYAKSKAKEIARQRWDTVSSCLTIHRLNASLIEGYETIIAEELTVAEGNVLTANPYLTKTEDAKHRNLLSLDDLMLLSKLMADPRIGHGTWRQMLSLLYLSESDARSSFDRLHERAQRSADVKDAWLAFHTQFTQMLHSLDPSCGAESLFGDGRTPFADALVASDILRKERLIEPYAEPA